MESVCVYIDGSNLYHSMKSECARADLDFEKFVAWLVGKRKLVRTYYYNVPLPVAVDPNTAKGQQRFFDGLRRIPYFDVRLGRLEPRGNTFVEKGVDVAIAIDMLSMAVRGIYDTAILVSCDGDFVKAVDAVRDAGKHVEVACFAKAHHLRQSADKVITLSKASLRGLWVK